MAPPRFDEATLRRLAGKRTFERGEHYADPRRVTLLEVTAERVVARVRGTEAYRVILVGGGRSIGGTCTCPAHHDHGFCKHQVAVALSVNAGVGDGESLMGRVRAYLEGLPREALIDLLAARAVEDMDLLRSLDDASAMASGDDATLLARGRDILSAALDPPDYLSYHDEAEWTDQALDSLMVIERMLDGSRATMALALADHAAGLVADSADTMSAEVSEALIESLHSLRLRIWRDLAPDPVALAADLFARERQDAAGLYLNAATIYRDLLGEAGMAEYRRLAEAAWRAGPDAFADRRRLTGILEHALRAAGATEELIALRRSSLDSARDYAGLASLCLELGRAEDALKWADEGAWAYADGDIRHLKEIALEALRALARTEELAARLWAEFEKSPTLGAYRALRDIGAQDRCEAAIALLKANLENKKPAGRQVFYGHPADTLVSILCEEGRIGEAWDVVAAHGASAPLRERLARASHDTHPAQAVATYAERVETLASAGGKLNYAEAAAMVTTMASLRDPAEHGAYLADLIDRHKRKRTFIALL